MTENQDITDFSIVDQTEDPNFFRRFLDRGNALPAIQQSKSMMLAALALQPGQRVLDLGCGLGDDVFTMAERVGTRGHVIGIDISEAMIEEARRRTPFGTPVEFHVGDSRKLEFPAGHFDAVRAERLLMHVPEATAALGEMVRVTRRGGCLCVFDFFSTGIASLLTAPPRRSRVGSCSRSLIGSKTAGLAGNCPGCFEMRG